MTSEQVFTIGPGLPNHRSLVGGKAAGLGELCRAGASVPAGVVLVLPADSSGPSEETRASAESLLGLREDPSMLFAVRSSTVVEDAADASYAGMFETYLNVKAAELWDAVGACAAAHHSERVRSYQERMTPAGPASAMNPIIIQRMVDAAVAGVAFSAHPISSNPRHFTIEAAPGLGENVVSGRVTPDLYVVDVLTGELIEFEAGDWSAEHPPALSATYLGSLISLMSKMRSYLRYEIDLEFAFFGDELFALQVRPITTLAA